MKFCECKSLVNISGNRQKKFGRILIFDDFKANNIIYYAPWEERMAFPPRI